MTENAKPVTKFLNQIGRSEFVQLKWPVEVDGKIWSEIEVRRISTGELAAFMAAPDGTVPPNVCAPKIVVDALDAEDGFAIEEATTRFFPQRFPVPTESIIAPTIETGAASSGS